MNFLLPTRIGGASDAGIDFKGIMLGDELTDADKQLAAVLLQLPRLIFESDSLFIWGAGNKKKRTTRRRRRYDHDDDTKKDIPVTSEVSAAATPTPEEQPTTSKQWPEGSSPDTPLICSFSPARPDPKPLSKRTAVKRRKEDYVLLITQLEKERESLKREIEDFKRKRNEALVANALLKRRREELILAQEREKIAKLEEVNTDLTLGRPWSSPSPPTALLSSSTADSSDFGAVADRHQQLILNRTALVADNGHSCFTAGMRSLHFQLKVNVGPKLPDLNVRADACLVSSNPQPSDFYLDMKAMATLARQKRRRILKSKTSRRI